LLGFLGLFGFFEIDDLNLFELVGHGDCDN
jgi:hypothetical protein